MKKDLVHQGKAAFNFLTVVVQYAAVSSAIAYVNSQVAFYIYNNYSLRHCF